MNGMPYQAIFTGQLLGDTPDGRHKAISPGQAGQHPVANMQQSVGHLHHLPRKRLRELVGSLSTVGENYSGSLPFLAAAFKKSSKNSEAGSTPVTSS